MPELFFSGSKENLSYVTFFRVGSGMGRLGCAVRRLVGWTGTGTVEVRTSDRRENPSPFDQLEVPSRDIVAVSYDERWLEVPYA